MLHLMFDDKPWFETRRSFWHPRTVRWQGHVLGALFAFLLIGIEVLLYRNGIGFWLAVGSIIAVTGAYMLTVRHRTVRRPSNPA